MALAPITFAPIAPVAIDPDDVLFAMHDPALCGMPGLFRYVDHKQREATRVGLRLKYEHGKTADRLTFEVFCPVQLGGIELAVLQALVAMSAVGGNTITPNTGAAGTTEQELVAGLVAAPDKTHPKELQITEQVRHVDFAGSHLLCAIGLPKCGGNRKLVAQAIKYLATVVLLVYPSENKKQMQRFHLLSSVSTDGQSDKWARTHVALNPRLTAIIAGDITKHTRISLEETRKLGTDQVARILHQRICMWTDDGVKRPVTYRTLLEYVYPDDQESRDADALRRANDPAFARLSPQRVKRERLATIQAALNKLEDKLPGWSVLAKSDLPRPVYDPKSMIEAEYKDRLYKHEASCAAAARKAAKDEMETVVHIRRGYLAKLSNTTGRANTAR